MNKEESLDKLERLVAHMDVPVFRKRSPTWLHRNLAIRNSEHPDFKETIEFVDTLIKKGIR